MSNNKDLIKNKNEELNEKQEENISGGLRTKIEFEKKSKNAKKKIKLICAHCGEGISYIEPSILKNGSQDYEWTCPKCRKQNYSNFTIKNNKIFPDSINGFTNPMRSKSPIHSIFN